MSIRWKYRYWLDAAVAAVVDRMIHDTTVVVHRVVAAPVRLDPIQISSHAMILDIPRQPQ